MDLIDVKDVEAKDTRNSKRRFLETDAVCINCGAIINARYEDRCLICDCGGASFISGKIGVDLRLLIDFHIEELRAICEIHGISMGGRAKMVVGLLIKIGKMMDNRLDERLVRRIIARNKKKFWFVRDIEDAVIKVRYCNVKLVDEKDMKE